MKRKVKLWTGKAEFGGVVLNRKKKQIILQWFAETEIRDMIYMHLLIFRLGWPPVRRIQGFVNRDNPALK